MAIKMCVFALSATTNNEFCDLSLRKLGNKLKKMKKNAKISNTLIFFRKKIISKDMNANIYRMK